MKTAFHELVPCIRELNEATDALRVREETLEQLCLVQTLIQTEASTFFKLSFQVKTGEVVDYVVFSVENLSKTSKFCSSFWSLTVRKPSGSCVNFKFCEDFRPGSSESFLVPIPELEPQKDSEDLFCMNLEGLITFSLNWNGVSYAKNISVGSITLDLLHFLKQGKSWISSCPSTSKMFGTAMASGPFNLPRPTSTILPLNMKCANRLLKDIMKDTGVNCLAEKSDLSDQYCEFPFYKGDVKVTFIWNQNDQLIIRCCDSVILYQIKQGILRRLALLVSKGEASLSFNKSTGCEETLHQLKLQLESLTSASELDVLDLIQIYQDLRIFGESAFKFVSLKD